MGRWLLRCSLSESTVRKVLRCALHHQKEIRAATTIHHQPETNCPSVLFVSFPDIAAKTVREIVPVTCAVLQQSTSQLPPPKKKRDNAMEESEMNREQADIDVKLKVSGTLKSQTERKPCFIPILHHEPNISTQSKCQSLARNL